jgi:geranylgeranyl reductase family protein
MSDIHDVVVVGAGPGGSATAHYLASKGMDVLLLDKSNFPREKTCGDGLTPRALAVLEDMGLLESVRDIGWRINGLEVHSASGYTMYSPIPKVKGYKDYLLIVKRLDLDHRILESALSRGAQFQEGVKVTGLEAKKDQVVVSGQRRGGVEYYKAHIAVLAVGANMGLLRNLGILKKTHGMTLAARGYFDGVRELSDNVQVYFENFIMPGYGWIFPLSESSANIGVGLWPPWSPWRKSSRSARKRLDDFLNTSKLKPMLENAKPASPISGYPLRVDFVRAPTFGERILLVGESAGLVSPLTGEGVDFALESGKLAAEFLVKSFETGDFSTSRLEGYDQVLRARFQRLFIFLDRARRLYINQILSDRALKTAVNHADVRNLLMNVMMGHQDAAGMLSLKVVRKIIFGI